MDPGGESPSIHGGVGGVSDGGGAPAIRKAMTFTSVSILRKLSFGRTSPRAPPPSAPAPAPPRANEDHAPNNKTAAATDVATTTRHRGSSAALRRGSFDASFREKVKESDDQVTSSLNDSVAKVDQILKELLPAVLKSSTRTQQRANLYGTFTLGLAVMCMALGLTHVLAPTWHRAVLGTAWATVLGLALVRLWRPSRTTMTATMMSSPDHRTLLNVVGALRSDLMLALSHVQSRNQTVAAALTSVEEEVAAVMTQATAANGGTGGRAPATSSSSFQPTVEGLRLNCFQGLANLDFTRDVLSKLTAEQQATYGKFQVAFASAYLKRVPEEIRASPLHERPDEFTELRFLQADNYDVDKAVERLCNTAKWRHHTGLNALVHNPNMELLERSRALRPRIIVGLDKHSRPLMVERLGEFFGSDVAYRGLHIDDWIVTYGYEIGEVTAWMRMAVEQGGPYQHRLSYIGDLHGLRTMTALRMIPFLKTLVHEVEMHYPELAGTVTLTNAPATLARLWGIVKKFLDPNTASKVSISASPWHEQLIELHGEAAIPMAYGGKNPIFVPACPKVMEADFDVKYPLSVSYAHKIGRGKQ